MSCVGEGEGASLEVRNKSRNLCHFHPVVGGSDGIVDKGELALELREFVGEVVVVVVVAVVAFHLCDSIPVVKIRYCLA